VAGNHVYPIFSFCFFFYYYKKKKKKKNATWVKRRMKDGGRAHV
jgi:hypothetical protein